MLGDRVEAYSAGTEPTPVSPLAIRVMGEVGVDISPQHSKSLEEFMDQSFDLVITLCDDAQARCPVFPGATREIHMGFPDPARAVGSKDAVLTVCRDVRDRIRARLIPVLEAELTEQNSRSD